MENKLMPPSQFAATIKAKYPQYKNVSDFDLTKAILKKYPQYSSKIDTASIGLNSTGDQSKDLGLQSLADKTGFSNTEVGKVGKGIFNFFTGVTQKFGEMIGSSIAAPGDIKKYSKALSQHTDISNNIVDMIEKKRALGQDTSSLETALREQVSSIPKIQDFVDQTTLQRLNQSFGENLEEVLGLGAGTALEALQGGPLESGVKTAVESGASLGDKILKGIKIGASYGAVSGASGALSNEESAKNVAIDTTEGAAVGAGIGTAAESAGEALSNISNKKSIFGSMAKVPSRLGGEEGALLNAPEAKKTILETQQAINSSIKNPDLPPASKSVGSQLLSSIITKANSMLDSIGERMGAVLKDPKIGGVDADVSGISQKFNDELKSRVPVSSRPDTIILRDFQNDLSKITGGSVSTDYGGRVGSIQTKGTGSPSTLNDVDQFLRKWQKVDASYQMQNDSVGALIDSTVHNINEEAKNIADEAEGAEPGKGEYSKTNDEYAELVENRNDAQNEAGKQRKATGIFDKANSIIKNQSNPSTASEAWRNLANQTGIPLGQPSALIHAVEQLYNGESIPDVLKTLRIGFSIKMTAVRTLQNLLIKSESDPDAIVQKMVEFIDNNAAKQEK